LVDPALSLVDLFGMPNVPFGLWVDEQGTIVRPAEVAFAPRAEAGDDDPRRKQEAALTKALERSTPERRRVIATMVEATRDTARYVDAVRDWVAKGDRSRYVLDESAVLNRSRARPPEAALAAAEFELAQHLHRTGHKLDAVPHFREAHRLDPENWSYVRQAFSLVDESMGDPYGTDILSEVGRVGPETFYPQLDI
jgi:hypothetical protein